MGWHLEKPGSPYRQLCVCHRNAVRRRHYLPVQGRRHGDQVTKASYFVIVIVFWNNNQNQKPMKTHQLVLLFIIAPLLAIAQVKELDQRVAGVKDSVISWRRQLHQHPELSNREYNTAAYVAARLKKL